MIESKSIRPSTDFTMQAIVQDSAVYEQNTLDYWVERANELEWYEKWNNVLNWNPPFVKWFEGGKINAAYNCIDRHLTGWRKNKAAIIFEGEHGDSRVMTYKDLHREVCRFANVLKRMGAKREEIITIYMPMVPEAAIAMLACARIGVPHSVVFGGFSAQALLERVNDAQSKILITCDGAYRKGKILPVMENVNQALEGQNTIESVIIVERIKQHDIPIVAGRDYWYNSLKATVSADCPAVETDAEDILFVLYTSGTTGKPKGVVHTHGGYLTGAAATCKDIFDLKEDDVYWCTADIGWITGHTYLLYGPLLNGATMIMFEGTPDYPEKDRFWRIVEKYGVNILYTSPTAIRNFIKWGEKYPKKHDLTSLRLLGSVGEPISPDNWRWFYDVIGGGRCPIVDTWWQTETGMIMISNLPGITPMKPGSCAKGIPGVNIAIVDEEGNQVETGKPGFISIIEPWPAMLRTLYKDDERYIKTYWSQWPGKNIYFAGDGAIGDVDGYIWISGRVDDVINISGHRIGTAEVENVLLQNAAISEAACVGIPHEIKGQVMVAFVSLKDGYLATNSLIKDLTENVAEKIGNIVGLEEIIFTSELPKTQSGKTIRRLLQNVAEGKDLGDISTLANPAALNDLQRFLKHSGKIPEIETTLMLP